MYCTWRRKYICDKKVKLSRYRPGVAQSVGRGIALLFHDRGTRRGWVVSSTPRPHFTPGKDPVHILQEAGWAPGPVWTGGKSRSHRDSTPDRPARSQSLYRLWYVAELLLELEIFQTKVVRKIKSHILCWVTFYSPKNHDIYEIMWKNIVESGRLQMTM